jgi:hypothetical protein
MESGKLTANLYSDFILRLAGMKILKISHAKAQITAISPPGQAAAGEN